MIRITELFEIEYGHSLELNKLTKDANGVNFISRTAKNNGVSAKIKRIDIDPFPANLITVSLGGSVLEAFLQPAPFYTGFHIFCLKPKQKMTRNVMLYYCQCIRANKYKYNYGRQANRSFKDLLVPDLNELPTWVTRQDLIDLNNFHRKKRFIYIDIKSIHWSWFSISQLFYIKKGRRLTKANMVTGSTPYIGAIDSNNGYRQRIDVSPIHDGNTISVNYNGSVAEAFFQPLPFWASDDVNVLYPKFKLNVYNALFICSIIRLEKYRFNYGRKWHLERMNATRIRLPSNEKGDPDFLLMENYIKSLPFSKTL